MNAFAPLPSLRPLAIVDDEAPGVVAPPGKIMAWAKESNAGDRFVYATRAHLPPGSAGARAARELSDRGLVFLTQRRADTSILGEFTYTATRSSKPWLAPVIACAKPVLTARAEKRDESGDYSAGDLLLPLLERAAQFGRPCPTDKQLASRAGIIVDRVRPGLDALRAMQLIVVHPAPAPTLRFVTILSTGARTGHAKAEKA